MCFTALLNLSRLSDAAQRKPVEERLALQAHHRDVVRPRLPVGQHHEVLRRDDVVIDVDLEPVGRGEEVDDPVVRSLLAAGGKDPGVDLDEKAVVADQLVTEDQRIGPGHVVIDALRLKSAP